MTIDSTLSWITARKKLWLQAGLALLGLAAFLLLIWSTSEHGIGVRSDSVDYAWAGESFAHGYGLGRFDGDRIFKPLTQFPPLYPILLGFFEFVGVGVWEGARWIAALAFAANIVFIGIAVHRLTSSTLFALSAAFFAFIAPFVFEVNLWAMTEPIYVAFAFPAFFFLDDYFRTEKLRDLVWAGVFLAFACLTRYVGFSALGAATLVVFFRPGKPWSAKLQETAILDGVALAPTILWFARNFFAAGTATNKILSYHPIPAQKIEILKTAVTNWVAPLRDLFAIGRRKLAALVLLGGASYLYYRSQQPVSKSKSKKLIAKKSKQAEHGSPNLFAWLLLVYALAYSALVLFSASFLGASIPLDDRILYPLFAVIVIALFAGIQWLWTRSLQIHRTLAIAVLVLFGLVGFSLAEDYFPETVNLAQESRDSGKGYALFRLQERDVVQTLLSYPDDYVIYTDNVHQLYYFSQRLGYLFPIDFDAATQQEIATEDFIRSLSNIQGRLESGQAVMFVFFFAEELDETFITENFPQMQLAVGGADGYLYVSQ
jgi:hypothetical protein